MSTNIDDAKNILKLIFAAKMNPEKYSNVESFDELDSLLAESPEELEAVMAGMEPYSDDEIINFVSSLSENEDVTYAKNGSKLDYISSLRKGKKVSTKKCACGCDIVTTKEKGGKMVSKCACGCKNK